MAFQRREDHPDWRELLASRAGLATGAGDPTGWVPGLLVLVCADVIRPSLSWLLNSAAARRGLAVEMARTRDPGGVRRPDQPGCTAGGVARQAGQQALTQIAVVMAANGGTVGDLGIGDCLEVPTTAAATGELGDDRHSR